MLILDEVNALCQDPNFLSGVLIVKTIFLWLRIIIPILLIILGSFDLFKSVISNNESALKESVFNLVKRIAAGVMIFFLPMILTIFMNMLNVYSDFEMKYSTCISNAEKDTISLIKEEEKKRLEQEKIITYYSSYDSSRYGRKSGKFSGGEYTSDLFDPNDVEKLADINATQLECAMTKYRGDTALSGASTGFIAAQETQGINAFYLTALAALESGWATSNVSKACNNFGGVKSRNNGSDCDQTASDGVHYQYFASMDDYALDQAEMLRTNYLTEGAPYYVGKSVDNIRSHYCPYTGENGCSADCCDSNSGEKNYSDNLSNIASGMAKYVIDGTCKS